MLDKWAPVRAGQDGVGARSFDLSLEKLGSTTAQEKQKLTDVMYAYLETTMRKEPVNNFKVLDIARRLLLAGTGSLGMDRYYVLLQDDAEMSFTLLMLSKNACFLLISTWVQCKATMPAFSLSLHGCKHPITFPQAWWRQCHQGCCRCNAKHVCSSGSLFAILATWQKGIFGTRT